MSKVRVLCNGYGPQTKYKVQVFGSESSTYIREQIADILKPKNNILVSELKELLNRVDPSTNFYKKDFGSPDHFGWDDTNIEILCNGGGCEIIFDCAPHPVKIKVQSLANGKLKIMEDLRMIDFDCWRSSCDKKTIGYIANDKPKAHYKPYNRSNLMSITKVIFNPPATIVFWGDGSKTVVKCGPDDKFNPHVGIAMCVMKRLYGDKYVNGPNNEKVHAYNFHGIFRKWADPWVEEQEKHKEEAKHFVSVAPDVLIEDVSGKITEFTRVWNAILKKFEPLDLTSMLKNYETAEEDDK